MVPGGFDVISYTTRLIPCTEFTILFEIFDNFLHTINSNKKVSKDVGIELITVLQNNLMKVNFNIGQNF